jgi:tRNA_anti-like
MTSDPVTNQLAPKKSNTIRWILCGFGLLVIVSVCVLLFILLGGQDYWADIQRGNAVQSQAGTLVTADELTKDYIDDRQAADSKYKNKVLVVSGKIVVVEKDRLSLAGTPPVGGVLQNSVHCYVPSKNQGQLTTLQAGDQVKVKGYFSAEIVPIIKLEHCQIEK